MQNTDGDPLELTTMTYELGVTAVEAVERLKPLATLRGEEHVDDETYDATGALVSATLTWIKAGNRKHRDWDNTTLATLRVGGSRLVVAPAPAHRERDCDAPRIGGNARRYDRHRHRRRSQDAPWRWRGRRGNEPGRRLPICPARLNSRRSKRTSRESTGTPGSTRRRLPLEVAPHGRQPRPHEAVSGSKPCSPTSHTRANEVGRLSLQMSGS